MTLEQQLAARTRAHRVHRLGVLGGAVALLVLLLMAARFGSALIFSRRCHPPAVAWVFLGNSGSDVACGLKAPAAETTARILEHLGGRVGQTHLFRFASNATELYVGGNDAYAVTDVLRRKYLDAPVDKHPGTRLALALQALKVSELPAGAPLLIVIGTDSFEDVGEARQRLEELGRGRRLIILHHSVPVSDLRLRERAEQCYAGAHGDYRVVSDTEDPGEVESWLDDRLADKGGL